MKPGKEEDENNVFKSHGVASLIHGSLWVILGRILYYFISFVTTSLITHALDPKDYGMILQFSFLLDIGTTLSLLSVDTALVRQVAFYKGEGCFSKIQAVFRASLLTSTVFSSIVVILYIFLAKDMAFFFLNNASLADLVILISAAVPFNAITQIFLAFMSGFQDFKSITIVNMISTLVNRTLLTYAVLLKLDYYSWALAIVVATLFYIASSAAIFFYNKSKYLQSFKPNPITFEEVTKEAVSIIKFGLSLFSINIASILFVWSDNIIFPAITTLTFLSIVGLAKSINGMINNMVFMISDVFLPYLSEVYASHKKEGISYATLKITKISFFLYMPLFFFLIPLAYDFIVFYAGTNYVESAWILILLLALSALYIPSYSLWAKSELAAKRPILLTKEALLNRLSYIISAVILIPAFGTIGFVLSTFISMIPFWLYFYRKSSKDNVMKIDITSMIKSAIVGSTLTSILYFFRVLGGLYITILALIPCAVIYLNLSFLLGMVTKEEFAYIKKFSPKFLRKIFTIVEKLILI